MKTIKDKLGFKHKVFTLKDKYHINPVYPCGVYISNSTPLTIKFVSENKGGFYVSTKAIKEDHSLSFISSGQATSFVELEEELKGYHKQFKRVNG